VWLYKGSFSLSEDTFETEEVDVKDQTAKLKATFYAREYDGAYRVIADEDAASYEATTGTEWFTTVRTANSNIILRLISVKASKPFN